MRPVRVVLAHHDPASAEGLVRSVQHQFLNFAIVNTTDELRKSISGTQAPLAVVDLELAGFSQVGELCHEFPTTAFVCIHRLADDAMWSQSLAAGAVDCCYASDLLHVLQAAEHYIAFKEAHAPSAA
jgi:DNA-binding NarL/FixJ family response regulator